MSSPVVLLAKPLQSYSMRASNKQREVHRGMLKLYVWTVDDVELAKKMIAAGAESITTNKPAWLREQLAK